MDTYYITKENLITWLYERGADQDMEMMVLNLGYNVVECLKEGEQFKFGYQEQLDDVIEMIPASMVDAFYCENPNCELGEIEDLDWYNTEFKIKEQ